MNIAILTNEYPPHIYGGAGVHVEYLTRELSRLQDPKHYIDVLCFGDQDEQKDNIRVRGIHPPSAIPVKDPKHGKVIDPLQRNLIMPTMLDRADIVHCHTWYTAYGGCLCKHFLDIPMVMTTHSLEPHRPWKAEQLATGYNVSTWLEKTAYTAADGIIAVSASMERDVQNMYGVNPDKVRVIHNGIDVNQYIPTYDTDIVEKYGLDPERPFILFVGRITRQKGIDHLLRAVFHLPRGVQVLLCASAPDTEEYGRDVQDLMEKANHVEGVDIVWQKEMVERSDLICLYSHAAVFVCPSIYEPFGIINLEAMACGTPVVASRVGGIPEVVKHGETGFMVDVDPVESKDCSPGDADRFARELAGAVSRLIEEEDLNKKMGRASRERVVDRFGWDVIAAETMNFYEELIALQTKNTNRACSSGG